jgi:isopropylmalate/homocitrate/citramalate synthase
MLKALEFNLPMPSESQNQEILGRVKKLSEQEKRCISDDEFKRLYSEVMGTKA